MTEGNMITLNKTKITGILSVDYPQREQENRLIYLDYTGHLSFLPACVAILDSKIVTPRV